MLSVVDEYACPTRPLTVGCSHRALGARRRERGEDRGSEPHGCLGNRWKAAATADVADQLPVPPVSLAQVSFHGHQLSTRFLKSRWIHVGLWPPAGKRKNP